MAKFIEVESLFGEKYVLNVANLQGYRHNTLSNDYTYYFGGEYFSVTQETHDKIMDALDEYLEEFESMIMKTDCHQPQPAVQVVPNGLDIRQVKYQILNCDFLDAEQKLKLIVSLNI